MTIEPIAIFHSPFGTKFGVPRQSALVEELHGEIHFYDNYRDTKALKGLEGFDWLWLIWGFSANRANPSVWHPTVRPPRLGGNVTVGVFASRSPFRPNPLGLSSVRIEKIELDSPDGPVIHVLGADLLEGTPIYDIKPYIPYTDSHPDSRGGFIDSNPWKALKVVVGDDILKTLRSNMTERDVSALVKALEQDPRPPYQDDPGRIYGMEYCGLDVRFNVSDSILRICEVLPIPSCR